MAPPPAQSAPSEPKPSPTASSSTTAPVQAPSAAPQSAAQKTIENTTDAQTNGRKIAQFLIEKEPEKPLGYRLMRLLRWDILDKAPPAENGKTKLEPLPEERRNYLQGLVGKADWKQALSEAEKTFSSGATHFWLDLQRISATACKNLGGPYSFVRQSICLETALFIKRIPEIIDLAYSDGTPFCDNATKDWVESEVRSSLGSGGGEGVQSGGVDDPLKQERQQVNELVSAGKIDQAVEILQKKMMEGGAERISFRRSLLLCNLLFSAKHIDIALAILESLNDKIVKYNLDKWEPDLAVEAWCLQVKAYKMVNNSKPPNIQIAIQEKQNSILSKISCIDPKSALKLNS